MARTLARLWPVALALLIVTPLLTPGYVLAYDMVFVPDQAMRADYFGLGTSLPRAVPSDALVALASFAVSGQLIQKAVLLGLLVVAGFGMARLMRTAPRVAQLAAVSWLVWNPYVAERLLIGQWAVLVGYAVLPWIAAAALASRRGSTRGSAAAVIGVGVAALSASGGVSAAALALTLVWWRGTALSRRGRLLTTAGIVAVNGPWVVAGLHQRGSVSTPEAAVEAFAASGEGHLPVLLAVVGLGGSWNADTVLASREGWIAVCWLAVLAAVVAAGSRPLGRAVGRRASEALLVVAVGSLVVAMAGVVDSSLLATASDHLPGFALLRDGSRYLGGLAVVEAMAFGYGAHRLAGLLQPPAAAAIVAGGLTLAPLAVMPDLAWGGGGRLEPVDYPASWLAARDALEADDGSGSVLILPMSPYRAYSWNDGAPGLDPAPRFFPGRMLSSDALTVDGVQVQPENEDAAEAARLFDAGRASALAASGVGYVVVDAEVDDNALSPLPDGVGVVYESDDIVVYGVAGAEDTQLSEADVAVVALTWATAGGVLVACCFLARRRWA